MEAFFLKMHIATLRFRFHVATKLSEKNDLKE